MTGSVAGIRRRRTVAGRRETPHLPPDRDFYGQTLFRKTYPAGAGVEWQMYPVIDYVDERSGHFYCPLDPGHLFLNATLGSVVLPMTLYVFAPDVVCTRVGWFDEQTQLGIAGGLTMRLYYSVSPRTVSFEGLMMVEVPVSVGDELSDGISGYFNAVSTPLHRTHDERMGAGDWIPVGTNGWWRMDSAHAPEFSHPWSDGVLTWAIPMAWGYPWCSFEPGEFRLVQPDPCAYQVYTMGEWGTVSIQKSGHTIERNVLDWIWLDGTCVKIGGL